MNDKPLQIPAVETRAQRHHMYDALQAYQALKNAHASLRSIPVRHFGDDTVAAINKVLLIMGTEALPAVRKEYERCGGKPK